MTLDDFIAERRHLSFAWGTQDCATVAGDWVRIRTGVDPLAGLRAEGQTALQRLRTIRTEGGYVAATERRLGPALPGLMAQRGDVVLLTSQHRGTRVAHKAWGLCVGTHLVAPGRDGLMFLPVTLAEAAWRV